MTKRMLVDATHPEETRVAIVESYRDINRLDDLDFGLASKPILRGNIYLAKVMRVEPSLQAAFVEYGGNRHGFLPFSEIHPDYFRIPMADRSQEEDSAEGALDETESPDDLALDDTEPPESDDERGSDDAKSDDSEPAETEQAPSDQTAAPLAPETTGAFAEIAAHDSLITDFGNALIPSPFMNEVPMDPRPVESVGGDMVERLVRRHRPRYKIQEVLKRGQVMLIQVVKEERGNKGAALTSFLSLAGRYCVLMPNTDHGGGVSRKITNHQDRRRMKETLDQLEIPDGMAVILRTAGIEQDPPEIQRDLEYLLRLWDSIREQTLQSNAPALIYEEANLIKRSVRDLYTNDIDEILVAGEEGFNRAREFMTALMPDQVEKIRLYTDPIPLFFRYHVESQIDKIHNPIVQLRSGGYIVINPTEALVAIDVNSGRATRERHIEETALKTNLEAAEEIARQLRLRDLAGLIVIDFIDMEDGRNNGAVERRLKDAMRNDRARLQIGRISAFGLLELSRQRLRPSLHEINFEKCSHCAGVGYVRSVDSAAFSILRAIEEEGIRQRGNELIYDVAPKVALYIFNQKRDALHEIEQRYDLHVLLHSDETLMPSEYRLERTRNKPGSRKDAPAVNADLLLAETENASSQRVSDEELDRPPEPDEAREDDVSSPQEPQGRGRYERGPRRRRFRQGGHERPNGERGNFERAPQDHPSFAVQPDDPAAPSAQAHDTLEINGNGNAGNETPGDLSDPNRRRRRGRRGGRRRGPGGEGNHREHHEGRGRWDKKPRHEGERQPPVATERSPENFQASLPSSIHELDTTPRVSSPTPPPPSSHISQQRAASPRQPEVPKSPSSYEVVNPPTDAPKGGWWRRLTGQQD
jgi:ribonuclease E